MMRHTNPFLISVILHAILFATIFFVVKDVYFQTGKENKNIIPLKLCSIKSQKPKEVACDRTVSPLCKKTSEKIVQTKKPPKMRELTKQKKIVETVQELEVVRDNKLAFKKEYPTIVHEVAVSQTQQHASSEGNSLQETEEAKEQRVEKEYLDENMQKIVKLLQENLYYPRSARERGLKDKILVKFCLDKNGKVQFTEVLASKSALLSRAAIKTIEDLSGSFPKPKEQLILRLPINYNLIEE